MEPPLRILLIEMETDEYGLVKSFLRDTPLRQAHLTLVSTYQEAMRYLETLPCHLILLSTRVGKESLFHLIKELYVHGPHIPLVVLGQKFDNEQFTYSILEKGVQDVLVREELSSASFYRAISFATARTHMQEALREQSMTDELTGLLNRRGFINLGQKMLSYAKRHHLKLTLMMIDVDGFKQINDQYGHGIGDEALKNLGVCLKEAIREHDLTARLGGDEFVILVIHQNGDPSSKIYKHLKDRIALFNEQNKSSYQLSLSCGNCDFHPSTPSTIEHMLEIADKRLYADKKR